MRYIRCVLYWKCENGDKSILNVAEVFVTPELSVAEEEELHRQRYQANSVMCYCLEKTH